MDTGHWIPSLLVSAIGAVVGVAACTYEPGSLADSLGKDTGVWQSLVDFAPRLVKRLTADPTDTGIEILGSRDAPDPGDVLIVESGAVLSPTFAEAVDMAQGTILLWLTPYWDYTAPVAGRRALFALADFTLFLDNGGQDVVIEHPELGSLPFIGMGSGLIMGTPHLVVVRWDSRNPLNGSDHVVLNVDTQSASARSQVFAVHPPPARMAVGAADPQGAMPIVGLVAGLTMYRRPLFGGGFGVDLGNGDEIAAIYGAGTGKDPTVVTGSWDVTLALPTDCNEGVLMPTLRQAWTHPHRENLVGPQGYSPASLVWSANAAAVTPATTAVSIFEGSVRVSLQGGEVATVVPVQAETSLVLRAVVHSPSGSSVTPIVKLGLLTGSALAEARGDPAATRGRPSVLFLTAAVPVATTALAVKVTSASGQGEVVVHLLEVHEQLVKNPSLEVGTGDPFVPTDFGNYGAQAGDSWQELDPGLVHSGLASVGNNTTTSGRYATLTQVIRFDKYEYFAVGGFFWRHGGRLPRISSSTDHFSRQFRHYAGLFVEGTAVTSGWQHLHGVGRKSYAVGDIYWGNVPASGFTHQHMDDLYVLPLLPVRIEPVAADLELSREGDFLRLDGGDIARQALPDLSPEAAVLTTRWLVRKDCPDRWTVLHLVSPEGEYLQILQENGQWALEALMGGRRFSAATAADDDALVPLSVGSAHQIVVGYNRLDSITMTIDDRPLLRVPQQGATFLAAPDLVYLGSDAYGSDRLCDVFLGLPGAQVMSH